MDLLEPVIDWQEGARRFREYGFFVTPSMFSPAECEEFIAESERLHVGPPPESAAQGSPGKMDSRPMDHIQSPLLEKWLCDPRLVEPAIALVGGDVRLYFESAFLKPGHVHTEVPWHQDSAIISTEPLEIPTYWVALTETAEDNGCIWVVPGSHRGGLRPHFAYSAELIHCEADDDQAIPVPMPQGSVIVMSSLLPHRTGPNRTDECRFGWVVQYCPRSAIHPHTGDDLRDRLVVARDGIVLEKPIRERTADLAHIFSQFQFTEKYHLASAEPSR